MIKFNCKLMLILILNINYILILFYININYELKNKTFLYEIFVPYKIFSIYKYIEPLQ